jgi:hypothetical protein
MCYAMCSCVPVVSTGATLTVWVRQSTSWHSRTYAMQVRSGVGGGAVQRMGAELQLSLEVLLADLSVQYCVCWKYDSTAAMRLCELCAFCDHGSLSVDPAFLCSFCCPRQQNRYQVSVVTGCDRRFHALNLLCRMLLLCCCRCG